MDWIRIGAPLTTCICSHIIHATCTYKHPSLGLTSYNQAYTYMYLVCVAKIKLNPHINKMHLRLRVILQFWLSLVSMVWLMHTPKFIIPYLTNICKPLKVCFTTLRHPSKT